MPSHFVKEDYRKRRYVTRAKTFLIKRITEPTDTEDRKYKSITKMASELELSDYLIRNFVKSNKESEYIRSKKTNILYLLKKPIRDIAATARCAELESGAPPYQEFTSLYQLVKRFRISNSTIAAQRKMQPLGVECSETVYDEFKRKYYVTYYK